MQSFTWVAIYEDGTQITESEVKTTENIDREKLREFRLFKGNSLVFICFVDKSKKLIFRRRTFLHANEVVDVVYLVGWHKKVGDRSVKSICYIYSDGRIEFDGARNDLELTPSEEW